MNNNLTQLAFFLLSWKQAKEIFSGEILKETLKQKCTAKKMYSAGRISPQ